MTVTFYHNPRCSKSRETLALLEQKNISPDIVLYLENAPSVDDLKVIFKQLDLKQVRDMMRTKETVYTELNLAEASDEELFSAMQQNPILIERPIVIVTNQNEDGKAKLGRPPEQVLEIL